MVEYKYSPIKTIYIKDFQNIEALTLDFSKSPIIALVGDNEAGKTSAIKAFSVAAMHHNPRGQNEYIRDNTNSFGVAIDLEDGHRILRMKSDGSNTYAVLDNGKTIFANTKITDGLPAVVQDLMGMMVESETKEYLQIRSYEDKLLFVVTPASTNYKVMYNSLKVENLTKAIKIGNTEVNALKNAIATNEISFDTLSEQLSGLRVFDLSQLIEIKNAIKRGIGTLQSLQRAVELKRKISQIQDSMGVLRLIDTYKLEEIPAVLAMRLQSASSVIEKKAELERKLSEVSEVRSLELIDVSVMKSFERAFERKEALAEKEARAAGLKEVAALEEISVVSVKGLESAVGTLERVKELRGRIERFNLDGAVEIGTSEIDALNSLGKAIELKNKIAPMQNEINKYSMAVGQITNYLVSIGVAFETCQNCGASVVIDLDKLNGVG